MTYWSDIKVTVEYHHLLFTLGIQLLVNWILLNLQSGHVPGSIVPRRLLSLSWKVTCHIIVKLLSTPWIVFIFMVRIQPKLLFFTSTFNPCNRIFLPWQCLLIWLYNVKPRLNHECWIWKGVGWTSFLYPFSITESAISLDIHSKQCSGNIISRGQRQWHPWI